MPYMYDVEGTGPKVKGQIMYSLVSASPKALLVATSNFASA